MAICAVLDGVVDPWIELVRSSFRTMWFVQNLAVVGGVEWSEIPNRSDPGSYMWPHGLQNWK